MILNNLKNSKGTTLVEIIIYTAITSVIISGFVSFALLINDLRSKTHSIKKVETSVNEVFRIVSEEIKNCEVVIEPYSKASSSRLTLDIRNQVDNVTFEIIDGIVYLSEGALDPVAVTNSSVFVDRLNFSNLAEEGGRDVLSLEIEARYRYADSKAFEYSVSDNLIVSRRY